VLRSGLPRAHPEHPADGLEVASGNPPRHASTNEVDGAEWSGRDHAGALVFSRGYVLYRRTRTGDRALADFTGCKPDPRPAPPDARRAISRAGRTRPRAPGRLRTA
jgi:hypothetical protein